MTLKVIDLGTLATAPRSIACRICGFPMLARSKGALALNYADHLTYGCRVTVEPVQPVEQASAQQGHR